MDTLLDAGKRLRHGPPVKVCPNCGGLLKSTVSVMVVDAVAAGTDWECPECGYIGMVYVEAGSAAEVEAIRKEIAQRDRREARGRR